MAGSARSCKVALLVAMKAMLAAPIGTRKTMAAVLVGMRATARMMATEEQADDGEQPGRRVARWAVKRPPTTAPAPMAARKAL